MHYDNIETAVFLERPNRFIAWVETDRGREICHVKNTGRCRELLLPGAAIYVQRNENPARKTPLDLIGVVKGDILINMDSQAPNKVVEEWLRAGGAAPEYSVVERETFAGANVGAAAETWQQEQDAWLQELGREATLIRPEYRFGDSRFDFYVEAGERKVLIEVKGVTLEEDGVASFPDAPTERGVKHIRELTDCISKGYEACVLFVVQMKGMCYMEPNDRTHAAFGEALREAYAAGVKVLAYDCRVTSDSLVLDQPVPVKL